MAATRKATGRNEVKLSIRTSPETRQQIKAVAAMSGNNVESWLEGLINTELSRLQPALEALRSASER